MSIYREKNRFHTAFATASETPRERGLVAPIEHPAAPLLGLDEAGAAEQPHVMRDGRLGEAHGRLDVAGAEPPLVAGDELAAGLAARPQQIQDLQTRRVAERLEDDHQLIGTFHTSINVELTKPSVKPPGGDFRRMG